MHPDHRGPALRRLLPRRQREPARDAAAIEALPFHEREIAEALGRDAGILHRVGLPDRRAPCPSPSPRRTGRTGGSASRARRRACRSSADQERSADDAARQAAHRLARAARRADAQDGVAAVVLDRGEQRAVRRERPGLHVASLGLVDRRHRAGLRIEPAERHEIAPAGIGQADQPVPVLRPAHRGEAARRLLRHLDMAAADHLEQDQVLVGRAMVEQHADLPPVRAVAGRR